MAMEQFTDAIALLKADHRAVEELFERFKGAGEGSRQKIAEQICNELKIHTTIEEEILYPALRGKIEVDTLNEAYVEHDAAKVLVNDILAMGAADEYFQAKIMVLAEEIRHHVREEERPGKGMFAQAREANVDLVDLRDRMLNRKEQLKQKAKAGSLPPAQLQVVHA